MLKRYFKFISVFCLVLTFISQPIAARLSCEKMQADVQMDMTDSVAMGSMSHFLHAVSSISGSPLDDRQVASDCCEEQACSMVSRFPLPAMVATTGLSIATDFSTSVRPDYWTAYAGTELVSPYRPPIPR